MAKRKWGMKRICQSCGTRFYDLNRKGPQCPKCGAGYAAAKPAKPRRRAAPPAPAPATAPEPAPATAPPPEDAAAKPPTDAVETAGDDDEDENDLEQVKGADDGLIEDASELRKDDDDVSEVREHLDDGVEDRT